MFELGKGLAMTRNEFLTKIEEVISPCNSSYKKHREETAKRILDVIEEVGIQQLWEPEE